MRRAYGLVIAAALAVRMVCAQNETIRTTVPLVVAPASVTDRHGHPIDGLTAADFDLLDEGRPQRIQLAVTDDGLPPIAVVVAIETTDIALSALGKIRKTGALVANAIAGANGETAVITFDSKVSVLQDFTRDGDLVEQAMASLQPANEERGRMIDALSKSLDMLAARPGARRACVVVIGESKDRGSEMKLPELTAKAERSGATIYGVTYSAYVTPFTTKADEYRPPNGGGLIKAIGELARNGKANTVAALTEATGGQRFGFATKGKLETELSALGTDVHNRYLISFQPETPHAAGFHRLALRVKGREDAVIRVRPGYWATSAQ